MSTVAYYARISANDAMALVTDPEGFWRLPEMSWNLQETNGTQASECLYIDQDWRVLSWLCSNLGRVEERNQAALMDIEQYQEAGQTFKQALASAVDALGFRYIDPEDIPDDPVLTALQGRRQGDDGARIDDLGIAAALFGPGEVGALARALGELDENRLRERFDPEEMDMLELPREGDEEEFDEIYFPQLERVRTLYRRAVEAGQHVLVVLS